MVHSLTSDFKCVSLTGSNTKLPTASPASMKPDGSKSWEIGKIRKFTKTNGFVFMIFVLMISVLFHFTPFFGSPSSSSMPPPKHSVWARAKFLVTPMEYAKPVSTFKLREDLGHILEEEGMKVGVELGVQRGRFAERLLTRWTSAERYVLVDIWAKQTNYNDLANHDNATHDLYKQEALSRNKRFEERGTSIEVCQDFTTECAKRYKPNTFDFVYVDARHDYKGVLIDLKTWWPLLKPGGIMAGHDYVTNDDGPMQSGQNWSINFDGTVDPSGRAVKGAVDDFFAERDLQISVAYRMPHSNSWAARKPMLY